MKLFHLMLPIAMSTLAFAGVATATEPASACHIDGVVVENATISGKLYLTLKAPSGCGMGVRPTRQVWKIVVRDQSGFRTIFRSRGSVTANIEANGDQATVWAQFTVSYRGSGLVDYGHRTVYLHQGNG